MTFDYSKMKKAQLQALLKERGLDVGIRTTKAYMIQLLDETEDNVVAKEEPKKWTWKHSVVLAAFYITLGILGNIALHALGVV